GAGAVLEHWPQEGVEAVHDAQQVGVEHQPPILERHLGDVSAITHAGVEKQHVDHRVACEHLGGHSFLRGRIAAIGHVKAGARAQTGALDGHGLEPRTVEIDKMQDGAALGEPARAGAADPGGSTGDDDDSVVKLHRWAPLRARVRAATRALGAARSGAPNSNRWRRPAVSCFNAARRPTYTCSSLGWLAATSRRRVLWPRNHSSTSSTVWWRRRIRRSRSVRVELLSIRKSTLPLRRASVSCSASSAAIRASTSSPAAAAASRSRSTSRISSRLMRTSALAAVIAKLSSQKSSPSTMKLPSSGSSSSANMAASTSRPPVTRKSLTSMPEPWRARRRFMRWSCLSAMRRVVRSTPSWRAN